MAQALHRSGPQLPGETTRRHVFVAIDRATRWVFNRAYNSKTATNARHFLRDLERASPMHIRTILAPPLSPFASKRLPGNGQRQGVH